MSLLLLMHQIKERVNITVGPTVTLHITEAVLPRLLLSYTGGETALPCEK